MPPKKSTTKEPGPSTSQNKSRRKQTTPKKRQTTGILIMGKKFKMNNKTLREIRHLQSSTHNILPKLSFARVVKEIFQDFGTRDMRVQTFALQALQAAAEMYLVDLFEDCNICALHCRRITVLDRDMRLARQLRREW